MTNFISHDQLVFTLRKLWPHSVHGKDFLVGHEVKDGSEEQTGESFIIKWNLPDTQPSKDIIKVLVAAYQSEWDAATDEVRHGQEPLTLNQVKEDALNLVVCKGDSLIQKGITNFFEAEQNIWPYIEKEAILLNQSNLSEKNAANFPMITKIVTDSQPLEKFSPQELREVNEYAVKVIKNAARMRLLIAGVVRWRGEMNKKIKSSDSEKYILQIQDEINKK